MEEILQRFAAKVGKNKEELYFIYGGGIVKEELTFSNQVNKSDKERNKMSILVNIKTEEERKQIIENTKLAKMAMRKELNAEKNRNYHMDSKRPTEIKKYLEWNKSVHTKGLITNGIIIPIAIAGMIFHVPGAIALLVIECLSAAINFECINIQNYNICRIDRMIPILQKREEDRMQQQIEEFGKASEVIHRSIEQSESLPTFDEILANINDPEQLRQMREMFHREQEERQKQKKLGGK